MTVKDRRKQIIDELSLVPLRLPEHDTAERIEQLGESIHSAVLEFRPSIAQEPPANITGLIDVNPRTTFDRIAEMLCIRVETVDWLDAVTLAMWVEFAATIFLSRSLRSIERALMLAHELAHERFRRAPHREVLYLTLALLLPRSLVALLPPGKPISGLALQRVCPWPVPIELCEARAQMFRQAECAA